MRIVWSLYAIADREAIFDYIEADSPRAAARIDEQIEAQVDQLAAFPETGRPGRVPGTRELVLQRTPYLAIYRIEEERRACYASSTERNSGLWSLKTKARQCAETEHP